MTTQAAQRRLLEALAELQRTGRPLDSEPDSLSRMAAEMRGFKALPLIAAFPQVVTYYDALADLFEAVRDDLSTERTPTNG
jgi:hypothetical protein